LTAAPSNAPRQSGQPPFGPETRALVIGGGLSGLAATRLLRALGAKAVVADRVLDKPGGGALPMGEAIMGAGAEGVVGEREAAGLIKSFNLVVVSPGVPLASHLLAQADGLGIEAIGELELAWRSLPVPILAVTGTNGKTTTTSLAGWILSKAGREVHVGGNIGSPLSDLAADILGGAPAPELIVAEVSSFQLETVDAFSAQAAAILNLTPDHLDRHGSMEGYLKVKSRILSGLPGSGRAVLNLDDGHLRDLSSSAPVYGFSRAFRPQRGAWAAGGAIEVVEGGEILARAGWEDFKLSGVHNLENVMAAALLAGAAGADPQEALEAAKGFAPGDHRLETVGVFGGVAYIDDSKGTNVGAVEMALESLSGPVVLIMGGRDKGLDYGYLAPMVKAKVKKLILIGECRHQIAESLSGAAPFEMALSMAEAVERARRAAEPGGCVLLSPAAASFDMFRDYKDRGEAFRREVLAQASPGAEEGAR
jgi:UDP-N-acetylmuramoylalanine--D-glutamate ligase